MAEASLVLPCPAEPGVRAPAGPGGLLRLLQERVLPLHFSQRHHLPVLGRQPRSYPPGKACQGPGGGQGSGRGCVGSWAASGHESPSGPVCALQPGASWIADCARHHCSSTPLGAVLVRSPISCPPLNETECAKVSAGLPPTHSMA